VWDLQLQTTLQACFEDSSTLTFFFCFFTNSFLEGVYSVLKAEYNKWVTGIFGEVKRGWGVRLTTSLPSVSRLSRICRILSVSHGQFYVSIFAFYCRGLRYVAEWYKKRGPLCNSPRRTLLHGVTSSFCQKMDHFICAQIQNIRLKILRHSLEWLTLTPQVSRHLQWMMTNSSLSALIIFCTHT
jgi:hypothetical protein